MNKSHPMTSFGELRKLYFEQLERKRQAEAGESAAAAAAAAQTPLVPLHPTWLDSYTIMLWSSILLVLMLTQYYVVEPSVRGKRDK